jgi:LacI family transcriptional regulator
MTNLHDPGNLTTPFGSHDSEHERPTLKTIAAATGLAIATVSRALNDAPDIGEETKRRVRETALKLGYRPNRAGVRLRTGKTNVIALVLSAEVDVMHHTSRLIYSIADGLRGTAYHLVVMPFFADQDPMEPIRYIFETGSADGVILNQTKPDDPRIRYLTERGLPFATHGRTDMDIAHSFYDFDNEKFSRLAVQALRDQNRKHLLLLPPPHSHNYASHMIKGFSQAATSLGVTFEIMQAVNSDSSSMMIEDAVAARFAQSSRPDGMLFGSTTAAMAGIAAAERQGFAIGVDFDVVAKEAISFLRRFRPDIMVVYEDIAAAGGFLARAVCAMIDHAPPAAWQYLETPEALHQERNV